MRWGIRRGPWLDMAGTVPSVVGSGWVITVRGLQEAGAERKRGGGGLLFIVLGVRSAKESQHSHSAWGSNKEEEEKRRGKEDIKKKGSKGKWGEKAERLALHMVRRRVRRRQIT